MRQATSRRMWLALGVSGATLFFVLLARAGDPAQVTPPKPPGTFDLDKTKAVLGGLIEKALKETGVPSISIALVRDDAIIWKAAFGYANVRTRTPATPETMYNAASTFKSVTATALMQFAEQGKFALDHPVNRYLGDLPVRDRIQSDKAVTFTHVLSHWSGLTSWPGRGEATMKPIWGRELPKTLEQVVPELYSIRAPETYEVGGAGQKPRPAPQVHTDVFPAGNAYLTAEDMARFLGAHLNGGAFQARRILSAASVRQMHEPRFGGNYAFGFRVRKTASGGTMVRHTGRLPRMSSMMMGDVEARVGVYYMANATDVPFEIADAAIALLRGEPYTPAERRAVPVDPTVLDRYVGTYEVGADVFAITWDGATLFIQKNGKRKGEILAETPTTFFVKNDPATVAFEANPAGAVDRMVVTAPDWQITVGRRRP